MPAFTAIATRVYKDPLTTVYLNSIKQDLDYLNTGIAKAWVNFDGSAGAFSARSSFNVSSLTDSGTGNYLITFTTGMANSGYILAGSSKSSTMLGPRVIGEVPYDTGSIKIAIVDSAGSFADSDFVNVIIMGASNP